MTHTVAQHQLEHVLFGSCEEKSVQCISCRVAAGSFSAVRHAACYFTQPDT